MSPRDSHVRCIRLADRRHGHHTMSSTAPARRRIESIDVVRGVIMILMALDHTRDFFGVPGLNPTDLARTTAPLFFTRWITHFCAPVFFLLTGTGAFLSIGRRTAPQLARLLATRGLWLIVLEVTVVRCFAYQFNIDYHVTMLVVLWALGWSMIALAALVFLPPTLVAIIGLVMIATHNLLDPIRAASFGALAPVWSILHAPGFVIASPAHTVFVSYPLIPWIGVTAAGYGLGQWYRQGDARRQAILLRLGLGLTAAFVLLRWPNVYGDPVRWAPQASTIVTAISFFNLTKYPPSLLFLLMTLGPALLLLWLLDQGTPRFLRPAHVLGTVPLFYFVLHFMLIHLLAVIICEVRFGDASGMFQSARLDQYPITPPPGWGFSLPIVYLLWISVVLLAYPACVWYAGLKRRRTDWWLSYL
jgi:uncharacterized membrane protein